MVFFDFNIFIYRIKKQMRPEKKNKKIVISISLSRDVYGSICEKYLNKSEFLENCAIDELIKDVKFKKELKNKKIIL